MTNANPFDALRDELSEIVRSIVRSIVREEVQKLKAELMGAPQIVPESEERLLNRREVAAILAMTPGTVSAKMAAGEIVWTIDPSDGDRKVRRSWVMQYIKNLPTYTGPKNARREVVA